MSILQNILPYVAVTNVKLNYIKDTETDYIFELTGYKLVKNINDKNSKKILKESKSIFLLDINTQIISMNDYEASEIGNTIIFKLHKTNFPFTINETDSVYITGTFSK